REFTRSENLYLRQNMVRYRGFFSWNRLDSRENVIEYSAAPIYVDGRPLTIGIDRDITEQMRSKEEALRRAAHLEAINAVIGVGASSDSVHELMQQSSRQLAVALLADGVVLWVGDQISALGMTTHDAKLWQQRFEPDATAAYLVHESDGDRDRGRRLLAAPIIHEGRRLGGFVVSAVDVDVWPQDALALSDVIGYTVGAAIGRLRLLEQTQMQARQMQMLIDAAPDGILLLDGGQRVVTMNPAAREALTILGLVEAGDLLETLGPRRIDELLSMQSAADFVEIELKEKSLVYAVNVRPVFVQDMTHGWMLTLRNITGERDRQQRSEQQGRLAAVGQLAAGIAHDFNNILAVTLLLAQLLLQEEPLPERARQRVQTIIDQTNHAAELVRQILDFSRKSVIRQTFGDLAALLDETAELLRRTLPGNICIVVEHSLQGFSVEADFTRLKQVLMNLAVNAQDAMPAGGVLAIRLDRILVTPAQPQPLAGLAAGEWLRLTVADTGVGISADVLPRIFEPFFTTKEVGKGTGLGLAQVYGIVHQHGGEIQVESRKHDGTTFSIYLPAPPTSQPKVVEPAQSSSGQMPRPTLLYVEDDPVLRQTICDMLQMYGFTILSAESGEDALVHHAGRLAEIDLVVSDLSMPGMSGIELHHALRNRRPGIRTIILSGYPAEREQSDWQQEGIVAWMQKPVSTKDLVAQIREVL
ncbi:MAG: ATP-binding protein, partial [Caldilinea sp.]